MTAFSTRAGGRVSAGWTAACIGGAVMSSYVDVRFCGRDADPAIEAAIYLWGARFASMQIEVHRATLTIEASGRLQSTRPIARTRAAAAKRTWDGDYGDMWRRSVRA